MEAILHFLEQLPGIPIEYVLAIIAISALGLAAFAIHVIHSVVKREKSR